MPPLEQLRLAAALAHVVPGGELRVRCERGDELVVSRHPAADLTPCAMRRIVIDLRGRRSGAPAGAVSRVSEVLLHGALEDLGGGVVRTRTLCGLEQRWIASTLPWREVARVFDDLETIDRDDAVQATVTPDLELGVTVVAISTHEPALVGELDRIAAEASGTLLAEELIRSAISDHLNSTPSPQELDR